MAQLTCDNAKKYRYLGASEEALPNKNQEETLKDKLLKQLVAKQGNKSINLQETLQSKNKFLKSSTQESDKNCGLLRYEDFLKEVKGNDVREILTASNLSPSDIDFLLKLKEDSSTSVPDHLRLKFLEEKLSKRELDLGKDAPEHFCGAVPLNRHEYEEALSKEAVSADAEKVSSCLFYLKPYSNPSVHPDHPVNHLKQLEKQVFPQLFTDSNNEKRESCEDEYLITYKKPKNSLWDVVQLPTNSKSDQGQLPKPPSLKGNLNTLSISKAVEQIVTDYSKPFVWPLDPQDLISLDNIKIKSLTPDQVRSIPRFKDYNPGNPSRTLFLKNLPKRVSPRLLASIFGNFETGDHKIEYRVMCGKMQGQAFVKLLNEDLAEEALKTCLGYPIEGRPLVILFGKCIPNN